MRPTIRSGGKVSHEREACREPVGVGALALT
jgi:hypothetical protein